MNGVFLLQALAIVPPLLDSAHSEYVFLPQTLAIEAPMPGLAHSEWGFLT